MGPDEIRGDLQVEIMRVLWSSESELSVEQVRQALPESRRGAYTTVQTVLNRLTERELLRRRKLGRSLVYEPALTEADYVSASVNRALSDASDRARRTAIANLVEELRPGELETFNALAAEVRDRRRRS
jgi:predicted transcriptional regulator